MKQRPQTIRTQRILVEIRHLDLDSPSLIDKLKALKIRAEAALEDNPTAGLAIWRAASVAAKKAAAKEQDKRLKPIIKKLRAEGFKSYPV